MMIIIAVIMSWCRCGIHIESHKISWLRSRTPQRNMMLFAARRIHNVWRVRCASLFDSPDATTKQWRSIETENGTSSPNAKTIARIVNEQIEKEADHLLHGAPFRIFEAKLEHNQVYFRELTYFEIATPKRMQAQSGRTSPSRYDAFDIDSIRHLGTGSKRAPERRSIVCAGLSGAGWRTSPYVQVLVILTRWKADKEEAQLMHAHNFPKHTKKSRHLNYFIITFLHFTRVAHAHTVDFNPTSLARAQHTHMRHANFYFAATPIQRPAAFATEKPIVVPRRARSILRPSRNVLAPLASAHSMMPRCGTHLACENSNTFSNLAACQCAPNAAHTLSQASPWNSVAFDCDNY